MGWREMDRVSQGMIDGCSNYQDGPQVTARCNDCTASIDHHIDARLPELQTAPEKSLLSVQMQAGLSDAQTRANIILPANARVFFMFGSGNCDAAAFDTPD